MSQGQQQRQAAPAATATKASATAKSELDKLIEKSVTFTPFGESKQITINAAQVMHVLVTPTKSGLLPSQTVVQQFLRMCEAGGLNPWVRDAFLVGYETNGVATWSLITSIQALLKRSESNPNFDGIMAGVIVQTANGDVVDREGAFKLNGDKILGAWAKVLRKDRKIPFVSRINFEVFDQGHSRWRKDPGGMIVKCAKAAALRDAFPGQIGGCYLDEEFQQEMARSLVKNGATQVPANPNDLRALTQRAVARQSQQQQEPVTMSAGELPLEEYVSPLDDNAPSLIERACASLRAATDHASLEAIFEGVFGDGSASEWTAEDVEVAKKVRDARGKELMQ